MHELWTLANTAMKLVFVQNSEKFLTVSLFLFQQRLCFFRVDDMRDSQRSTGRTPAAGHS